MKKRTIIYTLAPLVVALIFIVVIYQQTSFNFGFLTFCYIVAMIVVPLFMHWLEGVQFEQRVPNPAHLLRFAALGASITLIALGWLSIKALDNYFSPDLEVYTNADHHALRFDGISIEHPIGFILAADSREAFFDDCTQRGSATIVGVDEQGVHLCLNDFTRPIRTITYNNKKKQKKYSLLGQGLSMLHFTDSDTLCLRTDSGETWKLKIDTITKTEYKIQNFFYPSKRDSMRFCVAGLVGRDSQAGKFIQDGLPLELLMRGTEAGFIDFSWLHIVRPERWIDTKPDSLLDTYKEVGYLLAVDKHVKESGMTQLVEIGCNGISWARLDEQKIESVVVPMRTCFSIGYGKQATIPAYFELNDSMGLTLRFVQPLYQSLTHHGQQRQDSLLVLSLRQQLVKLVDEAVESAAIFDLFHHMDNVNNLYPQLATYDVGCTAEDLKFRLHNINDGQRKFIDTQLAGTTHSRHGVKWLLKRENLRATAHCGSNDIKHDVWMLTFALTVLMLMGAFFGRNFRPTTTSVEFVAYACILLLVSLRWFLLWRTEVFPALSGVTWFEFEEIFRNNDNVQYLKWLPLSVCAIILAVKIIIAFNLTFHRIVTFYKKSERYIFIISYLISLVICYLVNNEYIWIAGIIMPPMVLLLIHYAASLRRWITSLHDGWKWTIIIVVYLVAFFICYLAKRAFTWAGIVVPITFYFLFSSLIYAYFGGKYCDNDDSEDKHEWQHRSMRLLRYSTANVAMFALILGVIDMGFAIIFFTFALMWLLWLLRDHVVSFLSERAYWPRIGVIIILFAIGIVLIGYYKDLFGLIYDVTPYVALGFAFGGMVVWGLIAAVAGRNRWNLRYHFKFYVFGGLFVIGMGFLPYGANAFLHSSARHTVARIMVHFADADKIVESINQPADERRYLEAALNHMIINEYSDRGERVTLFGERGRGYFKMQPHSKVGAMWNAQLTDISIVRYVIAEHSPKLPILISIVFLLMLTWGASQPKRSRWVRALLIQIPLLLTMQALVIWLAATGRFIFLGQDYPMLSINSRLTIIYFFGLMAAWVVVATINQYQLRRLDDEPNSVRHWRYATGRREAFAIFFVIALCHVIGWNNKPTKNTVLADLTDTLSILNQTVKQLDEMLATFQQDSAMWDDSVNDRINLRRQYASIKVDPKGHFKGLIRFKMQSNLQPFFKKFDSLCVQQSRVFENHALAQLLWNQYVNNYSRHNNLDQIIHARLKRDGRLQLVLSHNFYRQTLPKPVEDQWRGSILASQSNGKKKYWARNFLINGRRELVYPYGKDFFWIRTFGGELLAQRSLYSQKDDSFLNKDIELTLSPKLNSDLVSALRGVGVGASVIVANGDGEVWAMAEVKPKKYRLDPNNVRALQRFTDSLELYGGRGGEAERMVYGNANLKQIPYGPGSSQKPLVWTAVASQLDYNWDKFAIDKYDNMVSKDGNKFKFEKFAGQDFTKAAPFRPLQSDENNGHKVSLDGFMSHSSNVYNAVMAYIGSFTFEQLHQSNMLELDAVLPDSSPSLFRSYNSNDKVSFNDIFPIMQNADGQRMVFSRKLIKDDQDNCWLNESMTKMFFHGTDNDMANNRGYYDTSAPGFLYSNKKDDKGLTESAIFNTYAYVERSKFQSRGSNSNSQDELMELAIRSTAIGAGRVWNITPWKMAEAYGRMASLNSNLHLSVVKGNGQSHEYRTFSSLSNGYKAARPLQMKGMRDVFFSSNGHTSKGTAYKMSEKKDNNDEWLHFGEKRTIPIHGKEVFLYGKTGTTDDGNDHDKHRIGIIIANKDLTQTEIKDLEKVRYVTVYFTMPGGAQWNIYAAIINKVMNSKEFKNYMFPNSI